MSPTADGPIKLKTPIDANDKKSIFNALSGWVIDYESPNEVLGLSQQDTECEVSADSSIMTCETSYLQDMWNGTLKATFKLEKGQIVELTEAEFDGSY